jgi:DNA-binding transcriptional LysR family regulator
MINLEWLRTFRAVYKSKSLSNAAEQLLISQPTVSQHLVALESRVGSKLFVRKSKGVIETDAGRILNTMISGSIEELVGVEAMLLKKDSKIKNIITFGISEHLYTTMLSDRIANLGAYVHVKFGNRGSLIKEVEEGSLLYAIVPDKVNTFDILCYPLLNQRIVLVGTPDIDFSELNALFIEDKTGAQKWLAKQNWYAHDHNSNFIKIFWLTLFDKKRPSIVPNIVIPNEYEILNQQSKGSGLSVAFHNTVEPFVNAKSLQICELKKVAYRSLYLLSNKKKNNNGLTDKVLKALKERSI